MREIRNKGAVLLEVLFVLAVMVLALPIVASQRFKISEENKIQTVAHKMKLLSLATSNYLQGIPDDLEDGLNVIQGEDILTRLVPYGLPSNFTDTDAFKQSYQVQIDKTVDETSVSFNAIILVYSDTNKLSMLIRKKLVSYLGVLGGMKEEDGTIVSGAGPWDEKEFNWNYSLPDDAIIVRVRILNFFNNYVSRSKTDSIASSNTMLADLYMGYHDITMINAFSADKVETFSVSGVGSMIVNGFFGIEDESNHSSDFIDKLEDKLKNAKFENVIVEQFAGQLASTQPEKALVIDSELNVENILKFNKNGPEIDNTFSIGTIRTKSLSGVKHLNYEGKKVADQPAGTKSVTFGVDPVYNNASENVVVNRMYILGLYPSEKVWPASMSVIENDSVYVSISNFDVNGNTSIYYNVYLENVLNPNPNLVIQNINTDYVQFDIDPAKRAFEKYRIDLIGSSSRVWDVNLGGRYITDRLLEISGHLETIFKKYREELDKGY